MLLGAVEVLPKGRGSVELGHSLRNKPVAVGVVMLTRRHLERCLYRQADLEIASDGNQSHERTERNALKKTRKNDKYFELKVLKQIGRPLCLQSQRL